MSESLNILVLALSALTMLINVMAMFSILRSYSRLRQRLYVFIISLTAVQIVVGISFMTLTVTSLLLRRSQVGLVSKVEGDMVIEGLTSAAIILSSLNTLIVTYALHKRTTSMGRHRSDSTAVNGEGVTNLPAFDTMMRVLSLGNTQETRKSVGGRSSIQQKYFAQSRDQEKMRREQILNHYDSTVSVKEETPTDSIKYSLKKKVDNEMEKSENKKIKMKRKKSMSRLTALLLPRNSLNGNRRFSYFRSSSAIASHSYVGRHGNSVISVKATIVSLFFIWLCFVLAWSIPVLIRPESIRDSNTFLNYLSCPNECGDVIRPLTFNWNEIIFTEAKPRMSSNNIAYNNSGTPSSDIFVSKNHQDKNEFKSIQFLKTQCQKICSLYYFPLSKCHVTFTALVIVVTWLFMLFSSLRLLWLRKRSANVFVRCSALWRFILLTALLYMASSLFYVIICILDVINYYPLAWQVNASAVSIFMPNQTIANEMIKLNETSSIATNDKYADIESFELIASCLYLLYSAISPSLYLFRLLGFRRSITGL